MKFPYVPAAVKDPIPSLGGGYTRPRPIIAVRVIRSTGTQLIDGLLDTGSDDTVLEEWVAALVGLDLTQAIHRDIGLVHRRKRNMSDASRSLAHLITDAYGAAQPDDA